MDVTILQSDKKIILNSENIFKHFLSKNTKEFHYRKSLLGVIYQTLPEMKFSSNSGYCIFKNFVIKVIL